VTAALSGWLIVVSFLLFKYARHYNKFLGGGKKGELSLVLEDILKKVKLGEKEREELAGQIGDLDIDGKSHIQKVGLIRYNPFSDTGGNQSFVLALLDEEDTGVIISSLHTRGTTRWYAKTLIKGKPERHDLSQEEKQAVEMARKKRRRKK